MRFEIGPGGVVVILAGLLGLSGAVFGLGLIAGHELAGPEPVQQVASAYPLPAAPATEASSAASKPGSGAATAPAEGSGTEAATSSTAPAADSGSEGSVAAGKLPSKPEASAAREAKAASSAPETGTAAHRSAAARMAAGRSSHASAVAASPAEDLSAGVSAAPPPLVRPPASASAEDSTDESDEGEAPPEPERPVPHKRVALANPPPPANPAASSVRHPYSIQIDAVMDWQGAQQMAQKLRAKGFQPTIVKTQLAGQTWYRLRVGHYATPQEAQAAETKLHQEFNGTPAGH
jgi:SPOR domain